jgi:hypothetical protein
MFSVILELCKIQECDKGQHFFFQWGYYRNYAHKFKSEQSLSLSEHAGCRDSFCTLLSDTYSVIKLMISFKQQRLLQNIWICITAHTNSTGTLKQYTVWPFPCTSANVVPVCYAVTCSMAGVTTFPCQSQILLPCITGECIFINTLMFHLFFHTTAANSPVTLVFMSTCLRLSFLQNVIRH